MTYELTDQQLAEALNCCATPGGCSACPLKMVTDGCERRIMQEAAKRLNGKSEHDNEGMCNE